TAATPLRPGPRTAHRGASTRRVIRTPATAVPGGMPGGHLAMTRARSGVRSSAERIWSAGGRRRRGGRRPPPPPPCRGLRPGRRCVPPFRSNGRTPLDWEAAGRRLHSLVDAVPDHNRKRLLRRAKQAGEVEDVAVADRLGGPILVTARFVDAAEDAVGLG